MVESGQNSAEDADYMTGENRNDAGEPYDSEDSDGDILAREK